MNRSLRPLADVLFMIGAIKFGEFKLKLHEKNPDAPRSPIYIDLHVLRSFPFAMEMVVKAFQKTIANDVVDRIADIPLSISPVVAILSSRTGTPMLTPRVAVKERGTKANILGTFNEGDVVLLVDDLITKADSKFEAIEVLEANGLKIYYILVLVDREQGGAQQLEEKGYNLRSIFLMSDLISYYRDSGQITQEMHDKVTTYIQNN